MSTYRVEMSDGRYGESEDGSWPALAMTCGSEAGHIVAEMYDPIWEPDGDRDAADIVLKSDGQVIGRMFRY